jgi:hypothetical protein
LVDSGCSYTVKKQFFFKRFYMFVMKADGKPVHSSV